MPQVLRNGVDSSRFPCFLLSVVRFKRFDLDYQQSLVLDRKEAVGSISDILTTHFIPSDRSADLLNGTGLAKGKAGASARNSGATKKGGAKRGGKQTEEDEEPAHAM